jgi:SAM-dependent methyltransferase
MVAQAQQNLARAAHPFRFEQVDAQAIPFDEASFDAVIANHMLYHLPNLAQGLGEIRRVLKPGGRLYAATNGAGHLRELDDLIFQFDPHLGIVQQTALEFTLESGAGLLAPFFGAVTLIRYPDALLVTEAAPLAAYILSMIRYESVKQELDEKLLSYIEAVLQKNNGQIHIGKDAGLFLALR